MSEERRESVELSGGLFGAKEAITYIPTDSQGMIHTHHQGLQTPMLRTQERGIVSFGLATEAEGRKSPSLGVALWVWFAVVRSSSNYRLSRDGIREHAGSFPYFVDNDGFETYRSTTYGGDGVRPERKSATGLHWWILRPSQLAQFEEGVHKLASPPGRFFLNDALRSLATLKRSQGRCGRCFVVSRAHVHCRLRRS